MGNLVGKIKEQLTLEKILLAAIRTPGVKIKRDVFITKRTD